jgi:molybdate transport system substrate-binding protein
VIKRYIQIGTLSVFLFGSAAINAAETFVAVAANFYPAAKEIAQKFFIETQHTATLSFASNGKLYAQITHGAPYDVLLAADRENPTKLALKKLAVAQSRFTYATGKIALFSSDPNLINAETDKPAEEKLFDLLSSSLATSKVAIANPKIAPYGKASVETLVNLGVYEVIQARIVQGENISQTHQFIATGNAQFGFVALSQIIHANQSQKIIIPEHLYQPLQQDAILLNRGIENQAAQEFMSFMKTDSVKKIIRQYGYSAPL